MVDRHDKESGRSSLRKQAFGTASWLEGTLSGLSQDDADAELVVALRNWIEAQKRSFDRFMVGDVQCGHCGAAWKTACYESMLGQLACPSCKELSGTPLKEW